MQALRVGEGVGDTEPSPLVPLSFHAALGPPSSAPPQMREGALAHFDLACAIRMGRFGLAWSWTRAGRALPSSATPQ